MPSRHALDLAGRGAAIAVTAAAGECGSVLDTTLGVVGRSSADSTVQGSVDGKHNPGQESVLNAVTQLDVVEHRVAGAVDQSLSSDDLVLRVGGHRLRVGVVRGQLLDDIAHGLVPEGLTDVRGSQIVDGAVLADGGVPVQDGVDVCCATGARRRLMLEICRGSG